MTSTTLHRCWHNAQAAVIWGDGWVGVLIRVVEHGQWHFMFAAVDAELDVRTERADADSMLPRAGGAAIEDLYVHSASGTWTAG